MNSSILFLSFFLLIFLLLALFSLRMIIKLKKAKEKQRAKGENDVVFVVDTFHDLVSRMKQKEKELDELRKQAEIKAGIVETYNEYILQSVPSGVISFDREMRITKVNSAAEKILDISSGDVIGKSFNEIFTDPLLSILRDANLIKRRELQYKTNAGRNLYLGLTITPLTNSEGNVIGQLMVFTDLTDLKALQTQAELRDRLSSLGEMAAGIAHELRNSMGVISGYIKLLQGKIDPKLIEILNPIQKEVTVMDRIISDFLTFARPAEINPYELNLKNLLDDCINNIIGVGNLSSGIKIISELEGMPVIWGDEILLRQAFSNVIKNAVEAMPTGGELSISFRTNADYVEIIISDTGHGIPDEIKGKVFLPFYSTKEKGTGLGLPIAQKVIVAHGGDISINDSENGTTLTVRLPLLRH